MSGYKCEITSHQAYLSSDFGRDLAMRRLNLTLEELEKLVGRYSKGQHKGQLKGRLTWCKVVKGGWYKTGHYDDEAMQASGFVTFANQTFRYCISDTWTGAILKGDERELPLAVGQLRRNECLI